MPTITERRVKKLRQKLGRSTALLEQEIEEMGIVIPIPGTIPPRNESRPNIILDNLLAQVEKRLDREPLSQISGMILTLQVNPGGGYQTILPDYDIEKEGEIAGLICLVGEIWFDNRTNKVELFSRFISRPFWQYSIKRS